MQLTKQTDFAFRVLIYLASKKQDELSNIQVIAQTFGMSKSHVMKIVQKLVANGYVKSIRGQKGGIALGKNKADIRLREVVELMELTLKPVNCQEPLCLINTSCELKKVLYQAQNQYLEYLEKFTLDDIVTQSVRNEIVFDPAYIKNQ